MNGLGATFTAISCLLMLALPRRWAIVPLLLAASVMTAGQVLVIGPANFTVIRVLVAVGMLRIVIRGEHLSPGLVLLDKWMLAWAALLLASSVFHKDGTFLYRSGIVWSDLGCYFLLRTFITDSDDMRRAFRLVCLLMIPVALLMLVEKATGHNPFTMLGGVNETSSVRGTQIRASGPFVHPILAGTVGATCLGISLYLRHIGSRLAWPGVFASVAILYACGSSGPSFMALFVVLGLLAWPWRASMRAVRWTGAALVIALDMVMNDPVYFLMAKVDAFGGSYGYYRAQLIRSAIQHLDEWWLSGADRTRHWMPSGIHANDFHTDITNHFLAMGVMGGLPLMAVFVALVGVAFASVGRSRKALEAAAGSAPAAKGKDKDKDKAIPTDAFLAWTLGALLFGHVVNFFAISLFDQSIVFFYLVLACIGSFAAQAALAAKPLAARPSTTRRGGAPARPSAT
jgi:hypothetical protein